MTEKLHPITKSVIYLMKNKKPLSEYKPTPFDQSRTESLSQRGQRYFEIIHGYEMPVFNYPQDWDIKILPSFTNAFYRFQVVKNNKKVSVCLDIDDCLGYMGQPYFEIYLLGQPFDSDGPSPERFYTNETDKMFKAIEKLLNN